MVPSWCRIYVHAILEVKFEVALMVTGDITVLWNVINCSLEDMYQCFRGICCFHCYIESLPLPRLS